MKKTLLVLLLLIPVLTALCEREDFSAYLQSDYPGWTVESQSAWLSSAAAVLEKDGQRTLILAEEENGAWKTVINNPNMTSADSAYQVHMDTENLLFFSRRDRAFDPYDSVQTLTFSRRKDGSWHVQAVSSSSLFPVGPDAIPTVMANRTEIPIPGHWLRRETCLSDENDNLLLSRSLPPLRDVLTQEETDLAHLNIHFLPFDQDGYAVSESGMISEEILRRLFRSEIGRDPQTPGFTFDDGFFDDSTLQFIAKKPDGSRVLLCGAYFEDVGWVFAESAPLPTGAKISHELGTEKLLRLPQQVFVRLGRYPDGKWGLTWVAGEDAYALGPGWMSLPDESGRTFRPDLGDHPWGDIAAIDWNSIPASYDEAIARSDPAARATPKNPDPAQRLHLRREQSKSAKSLGKFYAGAPVWVLKKGKTWSKVRVGSQEGFMMNDFLLFGSKTRRSDISLARKDAAAPVTLVTWHDTGKTEGLTPAEVSDLILIGLTSDNKNYIVWQPYADRTGTVDRNALYDGADG